jgi:WD40 repeat protein
LDDRIEQLAVSASGKYVALASIRQSATTVSVWNIHTGAQERSLITGPWGVDHLAWGAADDTLSVFARPQGASVLTRFHVGSGEQKRILAVPPETHLLFDNDGQLQGAVYPGEDYPSKYHDGVLQAHTTNRSPIWAPYRVDEFGFFVPRGQKRAGPVYQTQQRAGSCAGGTRLIAYLARQDLVVWAGRSGCFLVWNLKSMKPVRVVEGTGFTNALVMTSSTDGQLIAIGGQNGDVSIWDTNVWKELRRFQASSRRITQLAFSPDGRHLATTGDVDGAAKVWDVLTGLVRAEFLHQAGGALGPMAVTRDGTTLVTTGYDVKTWRMPQ